MAAVCQLNWRSILPFYWHGERLESAISLIWPRAGGGEWRPTELVFTFTPLQRPAASLGPIAHSPLLQSLHRAFDEPGTVEEPSSELVETPGITKNCQTAIAFPRCRTKVNNHIRCVAAVVLVSNFIPPALIVDNEVSARSSDSDFE
jgi:hypothetical protein